MKNRNTIVELARFLFSILVVGYHVQMSMNNDAINFFENGAVAVEFFFLVSGYLMARTIEKTVSNKDVKIGNSTLQFMSKKIRGLIPIHIAANSAMLLVILIFAAPAFLTKLIKGIPGLLFLQQAAFWNESFNEALIVPEWYLSAMLLSMLMIFPLALFLRKKMKAVPACLGALGIIGAFYLACAVLLLHGNIQQNFIYDVRAAAELILGMLAYYLSVRIVGREYPKTGAAVLKVTELLGYAVPIVLGFIPVSSSLQPLCMIATVVGTFLAVTVTFAGRETQISDDRINSLFSYLGSISLPIYLFHPVVIEFINYAAGNMTLGVKMLAVFSSTILLAAVYQLIARKRK